MKEVKYSEILKLNKELSSRSLTRDSYNIAVLSNITVNQFKEICEYSLRVENVNADVKIGDYDNIVQDSLKDKDSNLVIIFWELFFMISSMVIPFFIIEYFAVNSNSKGKTVKLAISDLSA